MRPEDHGQNTGNCILLLSSGLRINRGGISDIHEANQYRVPCIEIYYKLCFGQNGEVRQMANSLRVYFCAVFCGALLQPVTGVAEVYKCVDEATGFTLFTDTPCPKRMTEKPTNLPSDPTPQAGDPPMPPPQRLSPFPKRNTYSGTGAVNRSSYKDSENNREYYESYSGRRYKYDLSNPLDQIKYETDIGAQLRDEVNPMVEIDRSMGQYGGGILDD
jgi:hypothetical protein